MNIQQLRAQIAALQDATMDENRNFRSGYDEGKFDALSAVDALLDSLQEEPVSEEFEKAARRYAALHAGMKDAMTSDYYEEYPYSPNDVNAFKAGAKWQKAKEESVTQDLGEYINELSKQFPEVSFAKLSRISVRVAKWQIAKLMKDATEVTVHIDASNYPYIPQIELYDYDKDVPLAKEGDKYKVILIKENKDE